MAKKLQTRPYDAAAYLKTEQDCALYLQAAIDEFHGDPALVIAALGAIAGSQSRFRVGGLPQKSGAAAGVCSRPEAVIARSRKQSFIGCRMRLAPGGHLRLCLVHIDTPASE